MKFYIFMWAKILVFSLLDSKMKTHFNKKKILWFLFIWQGPEHLYYPQIVITPTGRTGMWLEMGVCLVDILPLPNVHLLEWFHSKLNF